MIICGWTLAITTGIDDYVESTGELANLVAVGLRVCCGQEVADIKRDTIDATGADCLEAIGDILGRMPVGIAGIEVALVV